jgi:hypothetical protein
LAVVFFALGHWHVDLPIAATYRCIASCHRMRHLAHAYQLVALDVVMKHGAKSGVKITMCECVLEEKPSLFARSRDYLKLWLYI